MARSAKWRAAVLSRDKHRCVKCGERNKSLLDAHHVKPFARYPELAKSLDNGITLCYTCHRIEHHPQLAKRTLNIFRKR